MKTTILNHESAGNFLRDHMNNQLLKYVAGKHVFCPTCGTVLDWKTVVIIDVYQRASHRGKLTACTHCFKPAGIPSLEKKGYEIEVTQYKP